MSTDELRAAATRWDLLKHSFYTRWVAGDVTLDELRDYACQYHHVVKAIPGWLRQAVSEDNAEAIALEAHAVEEATHVPMWADFAAALGVSDAELNSARPNPATAALLDSGDLLAGQGLGAAVVWALEAQTPAVSAEKLEGLRKHYGIDAGNGGRYFELHQTMDIDHAAELEHIIASEPTLSEAAPAAAETMLEGLWGLLSKVERPPAAVPA